MVGRKLLDGSGVGPPVIAQLPWASVDLLTSDFHASDFLQGVRRDSLRSAFCLSQIETLVLPVRGAFHCNDYDSHFYHFYLVLFQTFVVVIHFFFLNGFNILYF